MEFHSKLKFEFSHFKPHTIEEALIFKFTNELGSTTEKEFPSHADAAEFFRKERIREQSYHNAKAIFESWPELETFYVTSDGTPFIRLSEARERMYDLNDPWYLSIDKDEVVNQRKSQKGK